MPTAANWMVAGGILVVASVASFWALSATRKHITYWL
jgi:hypothetical protein